jgi:uncharacterized protein YpuA (DUF1002 family)
MTLYYISDITTMGNGESRAKTATQRDIDKAEKDLKDSIKEVLTTHKINIQAEEKEVTKLKPDSSKPDNDPAWSKYKSLLQEISAVIKEAITSVQTLLEKIRSLIRSIFGI